MNLKMVFNTVGRMIFLEAALLVLPLIVALIYGEGSIAISYLVTILIALAVGSVLKFAVKPKSQVIYAKEGFAIVALVWLFISLIGTVPFVISKEIPNFIDAFFETVSGFTTTGASIIDDLSVLSHANLFWRSFTHWMGGMGVLVFVMAFMPNIADRSIHIMRAEMPGPVVGKLVPKVKDTAKILYLIYIALTALEAILLMCGGMTVFESLVHAFGTAGTGGFGIRADSIGSYSPYIQWVIASFMLLFGINFNLYYLILVRRIKSVLKSTELWCYVAIVIFASAIIASNVFSIYNNFPDTIRNSVFQVAAIITTTGFSTVDFNTWPELSKGILFVLMFIGGCAGSTAGGLKLSRAILLFKQSLREFKRLLHPRSVNAVRMEGKPVDESTLSSVSTYFGLYMICILSVFLLLSFEPFGLETNFSAAVSCFNNVGPGFGKVGPFDGYSIYSGFSKIVLSVAMLLGRLEIYPLLLVFNPATWSKNK